MPDHTTYSEELADTICERLAEGESLRQICASPEMPNRSTVHRWQSSNAEFATKCACARDSQADLMDDLILEVANACTAETAQADRVKISAYQWRASKLAPKKYGDKVQAEHTGEITVKWESAEGVPPNDLS
jgi:hypothetical protein